MIGIKNKEDLEKYSEEVDIPNVKESVDKLKRWNNDKTFINNITPEREVILVENTMKKFAREEGRTEEKTYIATNLLKQNIPIEQISQATGLSIEELKKIDISKDNN